MSRESILNSIGSLEDEPEDVPEWGQTVYLKRFKVGEWISLYDTEAEGELSWRMLAAGIVDDTGDPIFTIDDIAGMPASQSQVLLRLFKRCQVVNGDSAGGDEEPKKD